MLLAIDIGNTNTVVGVYEDATLRESFRVASSRTLTADEAGFFIMGLLERMRVTGEDIDSVVIASVVPPLTSVFETTARKYLGCLPIVVSAQIKLPIVLDFDRPEQIGADRIANSVAGHHKFGGPVIIVDFGTATTFDIVNAEGAYIGGVIIPGPETSMAELARRAARLFEIRIEPPDSVVGKSTAGAMKSGLFHGTVGQIDHIVDKIIEETGFGPTTVVATGGSASSGLAAGIEKYSRHVKFVEPNLTLEGLRLIAACQK